MIRTVLRVMLFAAMGAGLSACGGTAPGGAAAPAAAGARTSVGDALAQLQADYAAGRISESDYDQQRRAILTRAGA